MKLRKTVTAAFLAVFVLLTAGCLIFGPSIRDALSPTVKCVRPQYAMYDGYYLLTLPAEAVRYDENGGAYVFIAEISEKYPERCYEAIKKEVRTGQTDTGAVTVQSGVQSGDMVMLNKDIKDGERVKTK